MKNCTFSGSLKDCAFQGEFSLEQQDAQTPLENVDFSQAELLACTIANYDFGTSQTLAAQLHRPLNPSVL
ncbi:hypothetical protein ACLD9W_05575 [Neisseria sp. WLZKY-1]|uniref:hypothetical protein n=1 Tax=Neisseria sp. WLZKY-1 TaxID=3390377 RepID=UPI003979B77A